MKYSYTYFFLVITSVLMLLSCENKTDLAKEFSCKSKHQLASLEEVDDFNKNFIIKVPKYWDTKLYYDNVQSEIFSADTIKSLSESYIMNFSWVNDTIQISKILQAEVHKIKEKNGMKTIKESFHKFKKRDAYAHLGIGKTTNYSFRVFQYYIKIDEENYMRIKTEFYGDDDFQTRFCEALSIIEMIALD